MHCTCCEVVRWRIPVGVGASVRREWMSSTASVSSIYGDDSKWLHLSMVTYTCILFYRNTPPGQRHPSCRGRGPVLTLHLSFLSGIGKVWIVASAQESENPPLPLSAPASKGTQIPSGRDVKVNTTAAAHLHLTSAKTVQVVESLC